LDWCQDSFEISLRYIFENVKPHEYSDVDWAGSVEDCKSTYGCWLSLGTALISWMSRKQKSVALSTDEAGYIAESMSPYEVVWFWKLFCELFVHVLDTIVIFCDNQRGIRLLRNPMFYYRSKHIDISYHFIWDMVQ